MKKFLFLSASLIATTCSFAQTPAKSAIDKKVDAMVAKMTLEEKVGQMTQLTIDDVLDKTASTADNWVIDDTKLKEALLKYHIGSLLNVSGGAVSRKMWYKLISHIQQVAMQSRLKIPVIYGIDAMHGENYTTGATLFPQEIGMAATFNPDLAFHEGEITAYETRASYIPWNFSPVLDLGRNPLWPRIYETFGEDPYLAKTMGANVIKGYQGTDLSDKYKVAGCMKHYLGYSFPLDGKDRTPASGPLYARILFTNLRRRY